MGLLKNIFCIIFIILSNYLKKKIKNQEDICPLNALVILLKKL